MPDKRSLVIDAKFPLEAATALENAKTDDERTQAAAPVAPDISQRISATYRKNI